MIESTSFFPGNKIKTGLFETASMIYGRFLDKKTRIIDDNE